MIELSKRKHAHSDMFQEPEPRVPLRLARTPSLSRWHLAVMTYGARRSMKTLPKRRPLLLLHAANLAGAGALGARASYSLSLHPACLVCSHLMP